jgi:hypothetical protein
MLCERPNALDLLEDLGRRIGFRLDLLLGHCDPVQENSLRLLPNSLLKARFWPVSQFPVTLYRSLVWPFTPLSGFRPLTTGV